MLVVRLCGHPSTVREKRTKMMTSLQVKATKSPGRMLSRGIT